MASVPPTIVKNIRLQQVMGKTKHHTPSLQSSLKRSRQLRENALKDASLRIASEPTDPEPRFECARLLTELGRTEEAKRAYLELLAVAPDHFGALNNLGALLHSTGFRTAARTCFAEAIARHPENAMAYVNLANAFLKNGDHSMAHSHFWSALRLSPSHPQAHQGLATLFTEQGKDEEAGFHRDQGFRHHAVTRLPYRGRSTPIPLLFLVSAMGGNAPLEAFLDDQIFETTVIVAEFFDLQNPLPPHQLIVNAIGDADLCGEGLKAAEKLVSLSKAPIINSPSAILETGRVANARRLAPIEDVITPRMAQFPRVLLKCPEGLGTLNKSGFTFPFLLRTPGFHNGQNFFCIENAAQLETTLETIPGEQLTVMEFLNARRQDGLIAKYRVMLIDDKIYPLHAAVASIWKIHYVTAEMADHAERRAEDAAFLTNMRDVLGGPAMRALEGIGKALKLDYAGIDFGLNPDGKILLFEANATMVVHPPEPDAKWAYRVEPVERILDAVKLMFSEKAGSIKG